MKRSERLMRYTIVGLAAIAVLYVAANRLYAINNHEAAPRRTSVADLATLRDFSAVAARGKLDVEIVQGAQYSVAFTPADAPAGSFFARVDEKTLLLRVVGNQAPNHVRVTMPSLTGLYVDRVPTVSISGFDGDSLSLRLEGNPRVTLRNNSVRQWKASAPERGELKVDRASVVAGRFDLSGEIAFAVIE